MGPKTATLINYLIGLTGMIAALIMVNKKYREQPGLKIFGINAKVFNLIVFTGIGIFLALTIATLFTFF